jgi:NodT family efflux transporter outer membrane factor (OMF) lipoprotein
MNRSTLVFALSLGLAACAGGNHRAPQVTPPAAYDAPAGQAALATQELDRWWLQFDDPALTAYIDDAFRLSPDAKTATARLMEAKGARDSIIAQTVPTGALTGNANKKHTENIGDSSNNLIPVGGDSESETLNFNVSWEIDLFGRLRQARKIAAADFAAARFNAEGARAALAANVADAYFQARGVSIQLSDARETARAQTQLYQVAQRKAERGLGSASDADRVAGDLGQARSQVENLEAELHAAQRQLLILTGRGFEPVANAPMAPQVGAAPPPPLAVPGELLQRRPDVREAEARVRSAAGRAKIAHLAIFPTFTIQPQLGLSRVVSPGVSFIPPSTLVPAQQTTATSFWSLGVGLSQPVLDIPRLLAEMRVQDARTEQAVIAYEKAVQVAYGEAENALVRLSADERRVALLAEGEARARRAYDAALVRYKAGLDDLTSTLSAEQAWRTARSALTSERVQALRRAVQTYKALGGGWAYAASAPARGS